MKHKEIIMIIQRETGHFWLQTLSGMWHYGERGTEWGIWDTWAERGRGRVKDSFAPWHQSAPVVWKQLHSQPLFTLEVDRVNPIAAQALASFWPVCTGDTRMPQIYWMCTFIPCLISFTRLVQRVNLVSSMFAETLLCSYRHIAAKQYNYI